MTTTIIPTQPILGRSLIEHDEASRAYPIRALLAPAARKSKTWRRPGPFDQGQTSSCVGQTMKGMLVTGPNTKHLPVATRRTLNALAIYKGAQENDDQPGEEPTYQGTSALGACKYLAKQKLISQYRWCFSLNDVLDTLSTHGPVGIGIMWTNDMFNPDSTGLIKPTGGEAGGHEVELMGVDVAKKQVIGTNSWGTSWGVKGRFRLSWDDLGSLLDAEGDAVTLVY